MPRRHYIPDPPPRATSCNHPGCQAEGLYRAPKSRDQLNEYLWFCLDHVREYNRSWDFYAGMDTSQIERQVRFDTVWQRPTWPLGSWGVSAAHRRFASVDDAEFMPDDVREAVNARLNAAERKAEAERRRRKRAAATKEEAALAVLSLEAPVTWTEIRARYKSLVKRLHPDANGGDKSAEEQLKLVNQAYGTLKAAAAAAAGA
jgi:DnaJ-domain-containing protein 1